MTVPADSDSIDDDGLWEAPLAEFVDVLRESNLGYALIGGNARNVWATPLRSTDDFDFIVLADREAIERVERSLLVAGFRHIRRQDDGEPSGPDFVRMVNDRRDLFVDLQTAKTAYQELVVERALVTANGVRVATPEDIIVLKLIAFRGVDQRDLLALLRRDDLDWPYIEDWAAMWDAVERLSQIRAVAEA